LNHKIYATKDRQRWFLRGSEGGNPQIEKTGAILQVTPQKHGQQGEETRVENSLGAPYIQKKQNKREKIEGGDSKQKKVHILGGKGVKMRGKRWGSHPNYY